MEYIRAKKIVGGYLKKKKKKNWKFGKQFNFGDEKIEFKDVFYLINRRMFRKFWAKYPTNSENFQKVKQAFGKKVRY